MESGSTDSLVDPDMAPYDWYNLTDYVSNYSIIFPFETNWDRLEHYAYYRRYGKLMAYLGAIIYISGIYLMQKVMSYRKEGFNLRRPLALFNFGLAVFSVFGFARMLPEFTRSIYRHGFEHSVCIASYTQDHVFTYWIKLFCWSKHIELIDTLFLILRKRPVSFLHWYHHATVLVFTWHGMHTLTAAGRWFATMNYGVHAVMYTYFTWRSLGHGCPRWISMIITSLQLSQMVAGCLLGYTIFKVKMQGGECHHTWQNLCMAIVIYSTYLYLFARYFYFAYLAKATSKKPICVISPPCAVEQLRTADQPKETVPEEPRKEEEDETGYRFVFVATLKDNDYFMKKFETSEGGRRRKSVKRFEADTPIISDAYVKKRA